jgi:hypothetical protein
MPVLVNPKATVRKFSSNFHSMRDVWLFFQVCLLATLVPLLLRLLSIPTLLNLLTPKDLGSPIHCNKNDFPQKLAKYLDYILNRRFWIYRPNCLRRSLVLYYFLRNSDFDVQIYFGARFTPNTTEQPQQNQLAGHAWLVYQGHPYLESSGELVNNKFVVTYRFPLPSNFM